MNNKTIVITGSTRGIGLGLAKEFLCFGNNVVINGRSEENVIKTVNMLKEEYSNLIGVAGSVQVEETHHNIIEQAISVFGNIDIWINNAGIPQPNKSFVKLEEIKIKESLDTNIFGLMIGTKLAANQMIKQGFGKIFNMEGFGSDGRTMNKLSLYGTTKRAVNYFTKSVSKELKKYPVQVGVISPGMVRTDFLNDSMESMQSEELKRFMKVYNVLAEDVDVVSKFLVPRILKSSKNYDRIEFLTKLKMISKLFKMMVK
jgi:short-subunit dehydrogenase